MKSQSMHCRGRVFSYPILLKRKKNYIFLQAKDLGGGVKKYLEPNCLFKIGWKYISCDTIDEKMAIPNSKPLDDKRLAESACSISEE